MQEDYFSPRIKAHIETARALLESTEALDSIQKAGEMITGCIRDGGKLLLCGNGGSAADCQHIAAEFTGRFLRERKALAAESLTTNTSSITAIGNDYGFKQIFSRQVEAVGSKGDILMGLSTSGNSENVVLAMHRARELGIGTIGLTSGAGGTKIEEVSDCLIAVPSAETPRIQEVHILIGHLICQYVDDALYGGQ